MKLRWGNKVNASSSVDRTVHIIGSFSEISES